MNVVDQAHAGGLMVDDDAVADDDEGLTGAPYADPDHRPFRFEGGPGQALLVHGFMGTPREMRPLGRALADAGLTARGVLLPGFGPEIGRLRRTTGRDWVAAAAAAWDEAGAAAGGAPAVLVGFSMGGVVALAVAAAARRPPDRLVLLAPHWRFADRRARALPLVKYVIREIRPYAGADFDDPRVRHGFAQTHPGLDLDDPAVRERLRRETALPTRTLDELRKVSGGGGRVAGRVTAPTLVVQGRADTTVLPGDTRRLVPRLGGPVALREVDAGHMLVDPGQPAWPEVRELVVRFATEGDGG